ncbi:MAG: dockerin type I repeat-containing protein, partial [archaeon]
MKYVSMYLLVIFLSVFFFSDIAFAQNNDCIKCSDCDRFSVWKTLCDFISHVCITGENPESYCANEKTNCIQKIETFISSCKNSCEPSCRITDGCPDGTCSAGERCPRDAATCEDTSCYEPTCLNGCGSKPVVFGSKDESCNDKLGCTNPPCACDGQGNCIEKRKKTPPCASYGDLDKDGYVTDADVKLAYDWIDLPSPTSDQLSRADVNGNNRFDFDDPAKINNYVVGNISTFSVCRQCNDSDGGKNYYEIGYTSGPNNRAADWLFGEEDYCDDDLVGEWFCIDGKKDIELHTCPNGCNDGVCINYPVPAPPGNCDEYGDSFWCSDY